jgi:hypothetical protein
LEIISTYLDTHALTVVLTVFQRKHHFRINKIAGIENKILESNHFTAEFKTIVSQFLVSFHWEETESGRGRRQCFCQSLFSRQVFILLLLFRSKRAIVARKDSSRADDGEGVHVACVVATNLRSGVAKGRLREDQASMKFEKEGLKS